MPKVAGKHFAYTAAGKAAAKRHGAKTGKKVTKMTRPRRRVGINHGPTSTKEAYTATKTAIKRS